MKTATLPSELATRADDVRSTVAKNIDDLLKEQRWSRRAAATALGLSHRYVNDRAAGEVETSASDLAMFADFLGVPVARLFAEIPEKSQKITVRNLAIVTPIGERTPQTEATESTGLATVTELCRAVNA